MLHLLNNNFNKLQNVIALEIEQILFFIFHHHLPLQSVHYRNRKDEKQQQFWYRSSNIETRLAYESKDVDFTEGHRKES